jgi:Mrp family chromosome partitioning ATPase
VCSGDVPEPTRKLRNSRRPVMLADPFAGGAEPFRMLRTNFEFTNLEPAARTIMVPSAVEREGKSTTAANLAVALARAGQRVVLVDLDLRRPFLHHFFDRDNRLGLTDVAVGTAKLEGALFEVPIQSVETALAPEALRAQSVRVVRGDEAAERWQRSATAIASSSPFASAPT